MKTAIHTCKFLFGLDTPSSQVTEAELQCLLKYSEGAKVIVEIGCYEGKTTAALARRSPGQVYTIDPFIRGRLGISYGALIAKEHCRRTGVRNVHFVRALSYDVAPGFNYPIDFLFVDADHTYEGIARDWEDWFPKVVDGGILALHDSRQAANSPEYLGSMKFYEERIRNSLEVSRIAEVDSLAILKRVM